MSASSEKERLPQLGELMTELGLISEDQLATVLEVQQQSKRPLGQIIVELGFASGAAVAHALAMQSGGALKTEYGFALGVAPKDGEAGRGGEESSGSLPKLRLAATAVAPPARPEPEPVEDATVMAEDSPVSDADGESITAQASPAGAEPEQVKDASSADEIAAGDPLVSESEANAPGVVVELLGVNVEVKKDPEARPEAAYLAAETSAESPAAAEPEVPELEPLRAEVERLETALVEQERLQSEAASTLEAGLVEAKTKHERELVGLRDERDQATAELERLQTALTEADASAAEQERRRSEEQDRHSNERDKLVAQRDRLQEALDDALDRLAVTGSAAEERDGLRIEIEQFESTLAAEQATAAGERERLVGEVNRLEGAVADAQVEHEQELALLAAEHERDREERDGLRAAIAEAQASAADRERRLDEERAAHAQECDELTTARERLQEELGDALERLAALGSPAEERDVLRGEIKQLETTLAEAREVAAAQLQSVAEERDNLMSELDESRTLLEQAERVRDSQIALETERDRALTELEQLQVVVDDGRAELDEQTRLLAEEQDRHREERETLLAQRAVLERELGAAIEQIAAASSAWDRREQHLQLRAQRLLDALEAVRELATEPIPGIGAEPETEYADPEAADAPDVAEWAEIDSQSETEYSLFVPGPNGYELVPQMGIPPQAGQIVELVLSDEEESVVFEVVRRGRTLPSGNVCVYLAQV